MLKRAMPFRHFGMLIGVAVVALVRTAAQPQPGVIRIDAIVTDARGRSVEHLTPADFEVTEADVRQPIDTVRFINTAGATSPSETIAPIASRSDEQEEAARDDVRLFAVFLDEYHITPGEGVARTQALLMRLLGRELRPRDLVIVVRPLDSLPNLRLTRAFGRALDAVEAFEGRDRKSVV